MTINEFRDWATLAIATLAAIAPFALDWRRRREEAGDKAESWRLTLTPYQGEYREAHLEMTDPRRTFLLHEIKILRPRGAMVCTLADLRSEGLTLEESEGVPISAAGGYGFAVRLPETVSTWRRSKNVVVSIKLSVSSMSASRRSARFIVQSQPITLPNRATASPS